MIYAQVGEKTYGTSSTPSILFYITNLRMKEQYWRNSHNTHGSPLDTDITHTIKLFVVVFISCENDLKLLGKGFGPTQEKAPLAIGVRFYLGNLTTHRHCNSLYLIGSLQAKDKYRNPWKPQWNANVILCCFT